MMDRQLNLLAAEFHQNLTGAAKSRESIEYRAHCLLDSAVRIDLNLSARRPTVAGWQITLKIAAARLLPHCFEGPLPGQLKFDLVHCSFQAKKQSIVW